MKTISKLLVFAFAVVTVTVLSGCATPIPAGVVYSNGKLPVSVSEGTLKDSKTGTSSCVSVLGLFAWGDASIEKAAIQGNVKKISTVEFNSDSFCGVYIKYVTTVKGE